MDSVKIRERGLQTGSAVFFIFLLVATSWAQIQTNGYFAYDFVNNQADEGFLKGSFANPRMGFTLSGAITQNSSFICEALLREGERIELKQALVILKFSDYFVSNLGLYLVPFGKYNEANRPHQTEFINSPLTAQTFYPRDWRDMGFLIQGRVKGIYYSAYLGNGLQEADKLSRGLAFDDNNTSQSIGGRVGIFLDQGFDVSYSHHRGRYDNEEERNLVYHAGNVEWQTENFRILAEYILTSIDNPAGFQQGEGEGYFVQMSIRLGQIRPVASFQKIKYEDPFHGPGFLAPPVPGEGIDREKKRWSVGFVSKILENVRIKVEYDFNTNIKDEFKHDVFLCQMALNF
ncbi:MAG: hypothetical protein GF421_05920 [Candidatus Aminicenantes bacterium]|nr:hypothetical protein [Candidatus Aminicenantes bacterium]